VSKWVIVVPGIMGTSLLLRNDQVWPPSAWDVVTRDYDRIADLMNDDVEVGEIIRSVAIISVYKTLIKDVEACGYQRNGDDRRLIEFPYDWRRSNSTSAERLAEMLDAAVKGGLPDEITFVAHSMGGLVVRRILEGDDYVERSWFGRIRRLVTMGTPHFGAPLALARLKGDEKVLGVAGRDIVLLASDPRYPSSYELAGPANAAFALAAPQRGHLPKALDRFDPAFETILRLKEPNIDAANDFWSHLDLEQRPNHVEYLMIGGAAHSTVTGCVTNDETVRRSKAENAGDGTVPIGSAIVPHLPHLFSRKEHSKIFEDRTAREALYVFLDAPAGVRPQAADAAEPVGQPGVIGLSIDQAAYSRGEPIEIVGSYATPIDQSEESFWLERIHESGAREQVHVFNVALDAPSISNFVVTIGPDLEPGIYELKTTRPTDDPEPVRFQVMA
jgi:pimeloyl-ACP methyl ester carboxylesterase